MRVSGILALYGCVLACSSALAPSARADDAAADAEQFFEAKVRPILVARCVECHGPDKQEAALRLDARVFALRGNDSGPVIVAGNPDESRLVQVIRYADDDVQMPPAEKLPDEELAVLTEWVRSGAFWPEGDDAALSNHGGIPRLPDGSIDFARAAETHWAYRPVSLPAAPDVANAAACRTALDRFVVAKLESQGLALSPEADRRTLIRRACFDLLGLPPTYEEVEAFVHDPAPDAWAQLIDRLLASPQYGQRWGRHWLDVARYADTKGYVFTENRFYPFSYTYRDYVVEAMNDDKPYDRFVLEQLAADQLGLNENDPALAALGYLTVGPRFLNNQQDIADDRIDVTTRGLMGMTLSCARCHDHKYDPLEAKDYYGLYGVFESSQEPDSLPLIGEVDETPEYLAYKAERDKRQQAVEDYKQQAYADLLKKARTEAGDYLLAAAAAMGRLPGGYEPQYEHGQPREKLTQRWKGLLEQRLKPDDPVFGPWETASTLPAEAFTASLEDALQSSTKGSGPAWNPLVVNSLCETPLTSMTDVARAYGGLFADIQSQWEGMLASHKEGVPPESLPDGDAEQLRLVLHGPGSVADVPLDRAEREIFERDNRDQIRNLERQVAEWEATSPGAPARAMVLVDRDQPVQPVVFLRGNPGRRGDPVARRFPQVLGGSEQESFPNGSGRLDLARSIVATDNPLTSRVIVNRVWQHHFGTGLVRTASDFGARSDPPSHPELLDWLAATLMRDGWSLKNLHRTIMLSATYRQAADDRADARAVDPENRLLWRMNRRRLEFEPMRDSMLFVAGRLNPALEGRPVNIEERPFTNRRTVYALVDRNNLPGLFRTFDFPTPDTSSPERPVTAVPQQVLYGMNSPFVQELAAAIVARPEVQSTSQDERITQLFRLTLGRDPADSERELLKSYLATDPEALNELAQSLLLTNEFLFID